MDYGKTDMEALDRDEVVATFVRQERNSVPLLAVKRSLRSKILGAAMHHSYHTPQEFAARVREIEKRNDIPVSLNAMRAAGVKLPKGMR